MSDFTKKIFYNCTNAPYEVLSNLLREAFQERIDSNLNFGCALFTSEDLKRNTKDAYIVCFFDGDMPIAMGVVSEKRKGLIKYGHLEFLAVSPNKRYRGKGLGSQIQSECLCIAKQLGLELVTSTTAVEAISSVRTHLKTGFKIYCVKHYPERNYISYNFYYPLKLSLMNVILFIIRKPLVLITRILIK